jgi:cytochrome c biogenesis protein CcdA
VDVVIATLFALVAGTATALSPCVLPVLPVALAAGSTGGRRRPLGVAVGLAGTFALAAVLLTRALDALGLPGDLPRALAIGVLAAFGLALAVPRLGATVEGG